MHNRFTCEKKLQTESIANISIELVDNNSRTRQQAEKLSEFPGLTFSSQSDYSLLVSDKGLMLRDNRTNRHPVFVDFSDTSPYARRLESGGVNQLLAKAIGIKHGLRPGVIDCTAGIARDAYFLAAMGCRVTMLERSKVISALLDDALQRLKEADGSVTDMPEDKNYKILKNLSLVNVEAKSFLKNEPCSAKVIYIDTMFPERKKSALVKGEMQLLQDFLEEGDECEDLVQTALCAGYQKVVAKRPVSWQWQISEVVNHSIVGKTVRYDIFLNPKVKKD